MSTNEKQTKSKSRVRDHGEVNAMLERELNVVDIAYKRSQWDWEIHAMVAASSLYGMELLPDNVAECQNRLSDYFKQRYKTLYKTKISNRYLENVLLSFRRISFAATRSRSYS